MPFADKFTALGRGNGFPTCLQKVDVSEYDYWVTLGGTQKGSSASESEKQLSLANAMQIFWNLYGVNGTASTEYTFESNGGVPVSLVVNDANVFSSSVSSDFPAPVDRVCAGLVPNKSARFQNSEEEVLVGGFSGIVADPELIVRMYNGDTSDEDNFVGYGCAALTSVTAEVFRFRALVSLRSYSADPANLDPPLDPYWEYNASYLNISGIPLVVSTFAATDFDLPDSIEAEATSASLSYTFIPDDNNPGPLTIVDLSASFSSLEFYTY